MKITENQGTRFGEILLTSDSLLSFVMSIPNRTPMHILIWNHLTMLFLLLPLLLTAISVVVSEPENNRKIRPK